jgi:uncharacterized protein
MAIGPVTRDAQTAAFLTAAAAGQFLLRHCRDCGARSAPQAEQCERCASTRLDWTPARGAATLVSWTVAHGRAADGGPETTVLVIGELAEGPWWWTQLIDAEPAELAVGMPLRIEFRRAGPEHEAVPVFVTAPAAG